MNQRPDGHEKPLVNRGLCSGCGSCAELCPDTFAMDPVEEVAYVRDHCAVDPECIGQAVACCPEDCIEWTDDSPG